MRRRPVIHFVLLGALLFGLGRWFDGPPGARPPLALDAAAADALRRDWATRSGRAPSAAEWARLLDDALDEEALYRAAQARGLDRDDPVVQARLMQDMRFLDEGTTDGSALYRDAIGLGLPGSDLVVRRRLVERMRRLLQEPALADEPSDAELQAFLDAHGARFAAPARVHLAQVFLSRQRRGAALAADARRLLDRLGAADVTRAALLGDALPLPAELPSASAQDLATLFGSQFASAALALEPGRWRGPLASPYGLHLVWVYERVGATQPPLPAVRAQVRAALREERAAAALREGVRTLRAGYASAGAAR
jgi:hypothetical protein